MKRISMFFSTLMLLGAASSVLAVPVTNGLVIKLDADAISNSAVNADGTIATWVDSSGLNNHATQSIAVNMPVFVPNNPNFKGHSSVKFDGLNDWMSLNGSGVSVGSCTMFAVAKYDRTTGEQYIVSGQSVIGTDRLRFATNSNSFAWRIGSSGEFRYTPNTNGNVFGVSSGIAGVDNGVKYYLNGVNVGSGTNSSVESPGLLGIGSYGRGQKSFMQGDIAFLVIYNRILSPEEIDSVNTYLASKYLISAHEPTPAVGDVAVGTPGAGNVSVTFQWKGAPNPLNTATIDPLVKKQLLYVSGGISDPNMYLKDEINVTDYNNMAFTSSPITLDFDETYTWRIDQICADKNGVILPLDDPNNYTGPSWSFSTLASVPVIVAEPASVRFAPGDNLSVSVEYTSVSPATAQWFKNGQPLTLDSRITAANSGTVATLSIQDSVLADEGDYYCALTSSGGTTNSGVSVMMTSRLLASYAFEQDLNDGVGTNNGLPVENPSFVTGISGDYAVASVDGLGYVLLSTDAYPKGGLGKGLDMFTYSFWVKPSAELVGEGRIFGTFNDGSNTGVQVGVNGGGALKIYLREEGNKSIDVSTAANAVPDEQWSHVAVTYNGTTLCYFVDGVRVLERNVSTLTNFANWQYPLFVLAKNLRGVVNENYRGGLDDLRIYNYSMDEFQVADLYIDVTGEAVCIASEKPSTLYDFDNSCTVDLEDLAVLAAQWLDSGLYGGNN
ncbi:MAG: immunoglobulin domain-containing protein [Sedimentisphaerales bacterium]|nr:immunoglobulin domain-containing protein [Sedimentisphaerales bacterium]MBN2843789.1 immunoglobulin domain-containing protein [Sedimentisphaerales bacterium]